MNKGGHRVMEGLRKIVAIKASLNLGLSLNLKESFPGIIPVQRPVVEFTKIQDPHWLAGFVSGDGSFMVKIGKSKTHLSGFQVGLRLSIGQHSRDQIFFNSFQEYLGCGSLYLYPKNSMI
jgi:hypothetical protein